MRRRVADHVAMNLFRNEKSTRSRRRRLLTVTRGEGVHSDAPPSPEQAAAAEDTRQRVRLAIDRLPEREQRLLLLRAEGYSYLDIAVALKLNEASVGVRLARARARVAKTTDANDATDEEQGSPFPARRAQAAAEAPSASTRGCASARPRRGGEATGGRGLRIAPPCGSPTSAD